MEIPLFKLKDKTGASLGSFYIVPSKLDYFCQMLSYYRKIHGAFFPWTAVQFLGNCYTSNESYRVLMDVIKGQQNSFYQIELMFSNDCLY